MVAKRSHMRKQTCSFQLLIKYVRPFFLPPGIKGLKSCIRAKFHEVSFFKIFYWLIDLLLGLCRRETNQIKFRVWKSWKLQLKPKLVIIILIVIIILMIIIITNNRSSKKCSVVKEGLIKLLTFIKFNRTYSRSGGIML